MEIFLVVFIFAYALSWTHVALTHAVWGGSYTYERHSGKSIVFRTTAADFKLDGIQRTISVRGHDENDWRVYKYEQVDSMYVHRKRDEATDFEFFFAGFGITDLFKKYRDVCHIRSIRLALKGLSEEVVLMKLKQYEQRDWWFYQTVIDFDIAILRKLGIYRHIDEVTDKKLKFLVDKLALADLIIMVK